MKIEKIILVFLLGCLLFTNCKKNNDTAIIIEKDKDTVIIENGDKDTVIIGKDNKDTVIIIGDTLIIGKWKLIEVSIAEDYQQPEITDYSQKNIIYDFQKNNKLIVIGNIPNDLFIFDNFQKGEHFYEYHKLVGSPLGLPGPNLSIDKPAFGDGDSDYFCILHKDTMNIGISRTYGGVVDSTGLVTGGVFYNWGKTFIKLK